MKRLYPILAAAMLVACGGKSSDSSSGSTGGTTTTGTSSSAGTTTGSTTTGTTTGQTGGSTGQTGGSTGQTGGTTGQTNGSTGQTNGSGSGGSSGTTASNGSGSTGGSSGSSSGSVCDPLTVSGTPPANDTCAGAQVIDPATQLGVDVAGTTENAQNDFANDSTTSCTNYETPGADVVYAFTPASDGQYIITLTPGTDSQGNSWDPALYLLQGGCPATCAQTPTCSVGSDTGYTGDPETVTTTLTGGTTYEIVVDSYSTTSSGPFTLNVNKLVPPSNDTCSSPTTLPEGANGLTGQAFGGAANDYAPDSTATNCTGVTESGPDVVYAFTPASSGTYLVDVKRTAGSADLAFYLLPGATCPASGSAITSCVDGVDSYSSEAKKVVTVTAGTAYFLVVDTSSSSAASTTFDISAQPFTPPAGDQCSGPVALSVHQPGDTVTVTGDTTGAQPDFVSTNCGGQGNDIFYQLDLTSDAAVTATLTPSDSTKTSVVSIIPACGSQELVCADSSSTGTATVHRGQLAAGTYFIVADNYSGDDGPYSLTVTAAAPVPTPPGDTCAQLATDGGSDVVLQAIGDGGYAGSITFDTTQLSNDSYSSNSGPCNGAYGTGPDQVFRLTVPVAVPSLTVTATPNADAGLYEAAVYLRSAPCLDGDLSDGGATELACQAPYTAGQPVSASASSVAAGTYYIFVDGTDSTAGVGTLSVTVP